MFKTTHRYLAAHLLALGHPLLEWQEQEGYVEFTFQDNGAIPLHTKEFYQDGYPQRMIRGLDQVRAIIREAKEKGSGAMEPGGKDG